MCKLILGTLNHVIWEIEINVASFMNDPLNVIGWRRSRLRPKRIKSLIGRMVDTIQVSIAISMIFPRLPFDTLNYVTVKLVYNVLYWTKNICSLYP